MTYTRISSIDKNGIKKRMASKLPKLHRTTAKKVVVLFADFKLSPALTWVCLKMQWIQSLSKSCSCVFNLNSRDATNCLGPQEWWPIWPFCRMQSSRKHLMSLIRCWLSGTEFAAAIGLRVILAETIQLCSWSPDYGLLLQLYYKQLHSI